MSQKFILTNDKDCQTKLAHDVPKEVADHVRKVCEANASIRSCYLLNVRFNESGMIALAIAVDVDDEQTAMNGIVRQFQEMLQRFPAIATQTIILSANAFKAAYAGNEFYVR